MNIQALTYMNVEASYREFCSFHNENNTRFLNLNFVFLCCIYEYSENSVLCHMMNLVSFSIVSQCSIIILLRNKMGISKWEEYILQCLFICNERWSDLEKDLWHKWHLKGFWPVCFLKWRVSSSERANFHVQPSQVHW